MSQLCHRHRFVVVTAARDGSIVAESSVEETVTVDIGANGVEVTVGGSATVRIGETDA